MNNNASDLCHFLKLPWCAETLTAPDIKLLHEIQNPLGSVMNRGAFANGILAIPDGVRAQLAYFHQKPQESRPIGAPFPELCVMYDIGPGVAGWAGRGHGGFLSYLFDTVAGWLALLNTHHAGKVQGTPQMGEPTTMRARLEVNYRKPMVLDGVFIVTATIKQLEGKKMYVDLKMENESRQICYFSCIFSVSPPFGNCAGVSHRDTNFSAKTKILGNSESNEYLAYRPEEAVYEWRTTTGEVFLVRLIFGGWEQAVQNLYATLALNKVRLLGEVYSNDYKEAELLANLWLQTAL
ncbi:thioesterase superfamily member 4 [Fusarium bulbicola]|nr:thioesterase superfamily member 4 [Fusarium bulbicola]